MKAAFEMKDKRLEEMVANDNRQHTATHKSRLVFELWWWGGGLPFLHKSLILTSFLYLCVLLIDCG